MIFGTASLFYIVFAAYGPSLLVGAARRRAA